MSEVYFFKEKTLIKYNKYLDNYYQKGRRLMKKEIFINNFERLRKQAGLSRKKVFEDLGLSQSLFTNWKKQYKLPTV